ncbi:hypothetical protein FI667_g7249, partial [Globisporangium splendens]
MIASIWKRNHLLVALALAVLCAVLNTHSATAYNASAIEASEGHGVRGLAASAIQATSAPTPSKTKKPKKTKTPKPTKASKTPKPATPAPRATTEAPSTVAADAVTTAASSGTAISVKKTSTGKCVTGDPSTSYISKAYVDWIWNNRMKSYVPGFKNYIFDQLMTNNGKLSYCVRWESTNKLTKATASKFKAMLERQYAQWNKWLIGYGCWPFSKIEIEMVGIAVKDKSLIDWTDNSLGTIHVGVLDAGGVPQCPDACYKHRNFEASSDTSACKGKPFDISLWPTLGQGGGAGGDWGQRIDASSMLSTLDADSSVIVAHEIGHGFGLPDFYQESEKPGPDMPKMIMEAGASMSVTEGDGWLIRRAWENVRMRYPSTSG